jgi:hypothetical protein
MLYIKYLTWIAMVLGPLGSVLIGIYPRNRLVGYMCFAIASAIWAAFGLSIGSIPMAISSSVYVVIEIISVITALKKGG